MVRFLWLLALLPRLALAQWVSLGVAGGVPISPFSDNPGQICDRTIPLGCGPNNYFAKPYSVGPVADLHLPFGFSAESGFLYERFHKDLTARFTLTHGGLLNLGKRYSIAANGWLFPFLLRYTFRRRRFTPFALAGATLRHLGAFSGQGVQLDLFLQPQTIFLNFQTGRSLDVAVTAGAGVRWKLDRFEIAPEIRFLHWTALYYQPVQNQAMLMLTIRFPARR